MINENALSFFQKKCIVHLSTKEIKLGTRLSRERTTNGRIRVDKKPRKLGSHLIHKKCVGYALLRREGARNPTRLGRVTIRTHKTDQAPVSHFDRSPMANSNCSIRGPMALAKYKSSRRPKIATK